MKTFIRTILLKKLPHFQICATSLATSLIFNHTASCIRFNENSGAIQRIESWNESFGHGQAAEIPKVPPLHTNSATPSTRIKRGCSRLFHTFYRVTIHNGKCDVDVAEDILKPCSSLSSLLILCRGNIRRTSLAFKNESQQCLT